MWNIIERSKNGLYEIWKTYEKYLVCSKYLYDFRYFRSRLEAFKYFKEVNR